MAGRLSLSRIRASIRGREEIQPRLNLDDARTGRLCGYGTDAGIGLHCPRLLLPAHYLSQRASSPKGAASFELGRIVSTSVQDFRAAREAFYTREK